MIELGYIKEQIEMMDKSHQIEVLRILSEHKDVCLNENSNGTFVNLTDIDQLVIKQLLTFISYVKTQQSQLEKIEYQREVLEDTFFNKGDKDKNVKIEHVTCANPV